MWYTVLSSTSFDLNGCKAGTVYNCTAVDGRVVMYRVDADGKRVETSASVVISPAGARKYFSKPTKSFRDAMEQFFMVCEAAYC